MPSCVVKCCRNHSGHVKKSTGITLQRLSYVNITLISSMTSCSTKRLLQSDNRSKIFQAVINYLPTPLHECQTMIDVQIKSAVVADDAVEVSFGDGQIIRFEDCWLRDNCRCAKCYRENTCQRAVHILKVPDIHIQNVSHNTVNLSVLWDDNHESNYTASFLRQFDYPTWKAKLPLKPVLWRGSQFDNVARVNVVEFVNTTDGAKKAFQSLLDYGVVFIEGIQPTTEATEVVVKALGGVQRTLYGDMWRVHVKANFEDTAFTNLPLSVHNDHTYFTESAGCLPVPNVPMDSLQEGHKLLVEFPQQSTLLGSGRVILSEQLYTLQILHCIEHSNGTGGESLLMDGFYGANRLRQEHPEDFDFLTKFSLEAEYIEEGLYHHKYSAPVIKLDECTQQMSQIRYNVYDRSPMAFSSREECRSFYRSYKNLARYYEDPANQWRFKLKPGTAMAFDNFRIIHGRTGFTGTRVLTGGYVARSDWLNKARVLKLIN